MDDSVHALVSQPKSKPAMLMPANWTPVLDEETKMLPSTSIEPAMKRESILADRKEESQILRGRGEQAN